MIINVLIILTASYVTYIYGIFVAVFGALSVLVRPCLVDEELIQSRREDELNNGRPERHFYAGPTMVSGNSEEGDLGDSMSSSSQSLIEKTKNNAIPLLEVIDDSSFKSLMERCRSEVIGHQIEPKDKIGYYNIFHTAWDVDENRRYQSLVTQILNKINQHEDKHPLELEDVLYAGFIYSYPNNDCQSFHYDYGNTTETYFIPLIDLSHQNGTEILYFYDSMHYKKYFDVLQTINNQCKSSDDVIHVLTHHNIHPSTYTFIVYSAQAFSLYKLPRYVFHRGKTNETESVRVMFQLVTMNERTYAPYVATNVFQMDAELDDALSTLVTVSNDDDYNVQQVIISNYDKKPEDVASDN